MTANAASWWASPPTVVVVVGSAEGVGLEGIVEEDPSLDRDLIVLLGAPKRHVSNS